jgi:hypothetical protein
MGQKYHISSTTKKYVIAEEILYGPAQTTSKPLFWLDGTISGDEFVDRTGNGRNFTITGKDWTGNYFPYKSAATISAPAGDAVLFAADVNSFLYGVDADHPNDIPVVSFFQNIDYENGLFCRHIAQVVDDNDVETTEPAVIDITLYPSALTGDDLSLAVSYYGVPTEITSGVKWVSKNGNDSTGDGSKLLPWLTIQHAVDNASLNDTVYIKSGEYTETNVNGGIYLTGVSKKIKGIGRVKMIPNGAGTMGIYFYSISKIELSGLYVSDDTKAQICRIRLGDAHSIDRCYFDTVDDGGMAIFTNDNGADYTISDSVIIGRIDSEASLEINTCLISNYTTNYTVIVRVDATPFEIINCKLRQVGGVNMIRSYSNNNVITIKGCDADGVLFSNEAVITTWDIAYNTIRITTANAPINVVSGTQQVHVHHNTFEDEATDSGVDCRIITINGQHDGCEINNNTIETVRDVELVVLNGTSSEAISIHDNNFESTGDGVLINVVKIDADIYNNILVADGDAQIVHSPEGQTGLDLSIYNNRIDGGDSGAISVGNLDGTGNGYDSCLIYENNVINSGSVGTNHSVFVKDARNAQVYRNRVYNHGLGIVVKGFGDTFTSVVWGNLVENCTQAIVNKGASGVQYYNNTTSNDSNGTNAVSIVVNDDTPDNWPSNDVIFKNNIIETDGTRCMLYGAGNSGLVSDYNILYTPNEIAFVSGVSKTWAQWQSDGYDANGYDSDPLLTNLIPQTGSDAIGGGETLNAAYDDDLDASTDWGDASTVPVVVTKQQTAPWDVGAYVL